MEIFYIGILCFLSLGFLAAAVNGWGWPHMWLEVWLSLVMLSVCIVLIFVFTNQYEQSIRQDCAGFAEHKDHANKIRNGDEQ